MMTGSDRNSSAKLRRQHRGNTAKSREKSRQLSVHCSENAAKGRERRSCCELTGHRLVDLLAVLLEHVRLQHRTQRHPPVFEQSGSESTRKSGVSGRSTAEAQGKAVPLSPVARRALRR